MKFLHPQILWLPARRAGCSSRRTWRFCGASAKHVMRYASFARGQGGDGAGPAPSAPHPAAAVPVVLVALIVACAGPTAVVTLPYERKTIILAMDVSLSMGARDVDPNRITAAQTAAKAFVEERPPDVSIGIVAFGATASLWSSRRRRTARICSPPSTASSCSAARRPAARSMSHCRRCFPMPASISNR